MIWQQTDPDQVSSDVRELLSRPEFRYDPSLLERFGDWVARQLEKIFGWLDLTPGGGGGAAFGGGAGALVAWLIIVVAVAAVIATVIYVVRNRVRRPEREDDEVLATEIEHRHPARHWADEAERLEARGEWKEALRCRYRELVRTLVDRRQLADVAGRTTGELREDLALTTPEAGEPFDRATLAFELVWYAAAPTGPDENRAFRAAAAEVLAAPVLTVEPHAAAPGSGDPDGPGAAERIEVSA